MDLIPPKYRRLEHFRESDVPTQTEVRSYLGSSLARIFNDYGNATTRQLLGVVPPLEGPVDNDLWISPSDQLVEKVVLKLPLTNKYTKACTHRGILEIGARAALKFEEETEHKVSQKFEKELMEIRKMFEAEKRRAVELSVEEVRDEYEARIEALNEDFETRLKKELDHVTRVARKDMRKAVLQERLDVEMEMMKKVRDEVARTVVHLHDEFQQSLRAQRDNMVADFNAIMRQERRKVDAKIESWELEKTEEAIAQRLQFQAQKIADIAIVVCTERSHCRSAIHTMRQCFERQIEALLKSSLESSKSTEVQETREKEKDRIPSDEKVERSKFVRPVEIVDKDGHLWRPILLEPGIPPIGCTDREAAFAIVSSEINFFPPDQYTDRVAHSSTLSLHSRDSLPFCYYDGKLYVRSDYRGKKVERGKVDEERTVVGEMTEAERFVAKLKRSKSVAEKVACRDIKRRVTK